MGYRIHKTMSHLNVYLDQNVYGHLLKNNIWQNHPVAQALIEASAKGRAYVWISPTHVVELMQATDLSRRRALAHIMLTLSGARRMMKGPEFTLVEGFGEFLNDVLPGSYLPQFYIKPYIEQAQRLWLGYLALLALETPVELGPGVGDIRRAKLESHLLHARIAADPDNSLNRVIQGALNCSVTVESDPLGLSKITDIEIEQELTKLRANVRPPSGATIKKIQRYRKEIAQVYGAIDIGGALHAIFGQFPLDLELTFDTAKIIKNWAMFQTKFHVPPLPSPIREIDPDKEIISGDMAASVLNATIIAAAHAGLAVASIGYHSLLRELEICLNQNRLPTSGSTLDVDHATAAFHCDIFVCHDDLLAANVKSYVKNIGRDVEVVSGPKQLLKALER